MKGALDLFQGIFFFVFCLGHFLKIVWRLS